MSIEETNKVDIVAFDEKSGYMILTITDHLDWKSDLMNHLLLLQDKINAYLRFIEGGELLQAHPKAPGRPAKIEVVLKFRPNDQALDFFEKVREIVEAANIKFEYSVFTASKVAKKY